MKILAIDPSLTNTAVFVGDEDGYQFTCFGTKNHGDGVRDRITRYQGMVWDVEEFTLKHCVMPDIVFIEAYSFGSNDARAKFSAEYGGLLREMLVRLCDRIYEVAPTTLKKFCTGKGAGKKEMVIAHLMKRYDVEFDTNDEYDAYGLYRLGLVAEGLVEPANQAQREAVDTVLGRAEKKPKKRRVKAED